MDSITYLQSTDISLAALIRYVTENSSNLPIRKTTSDYESLTRSIISQQLSTFVARSITDRLLELTKGKGITPATVLALPGTSLRDIGLSRQKISYIQGLASSLTDGGLDLGKLRHMEDVKALSELQKIKGVGEWTAQMFVMSQMGREDIFPIKDAGIRSAMRKLYSLDEVMDQKLIEISDNWSPQRSLACKYLWRALDLGYFSSKTI